jgi:hypothetical protein
MNYQNPETLKKIKKVVKGLTIFCVLILGFFTIFLSRETSSHSITKACSEVSDAKPGDNCLFYNLKLCQTVPSASYVIAAEHILSANQNHRVNCADLSDLPLCNQIDKNQDGSSRELPQKNCVKECSDQSFINPNPLTIPPLIRSVDWAVHNRDCIRFCDALETGVTAKLGVNCVSRKCHQLPNGTAPTSSNCNLLPCNLLTPDELNEAKLGDSSKKYCEGENIKCLIFSKEQLPYAMTRKTNPICKIHDCRTTSETCKSYSDDDLQQILNKEKDDSAYGAAYKNYVNAGYDLYNTSLCNNIICKPVIKISYRCTPFDAENPIIRNDLCDEEGKEGATCSGGYCFATIDCNLNIHSKKPECGNSEPASINLDYDPLNSWFYRPKPNSKATRDGSTLNDMDGNLCYTRDQMEYPHNNEGTPKWGRHPTTDFGLLGIVDYGYNHNYAQLDSQMETRSPGSCEMDPNHSNGLAGWGYVYMCGNGGWTLNELSDEAGYHRGYVKTSFTEKDASHELMVCIRFHNSMIPLRTCGARECGITYGFGDFWGEVCGRDICRKLTITDLNSRKCEITTIGDNNLFFHEGEHDCLSIVDTYVRMRAVKYSNNRICTFIDLKGTTAYQPQDDYYDGNEKLSDGTCIAGQKNSDGNCVMARLENGDCPGSLNDDEKDENGDEKKDSDKTCFSTNTNYWRGVAHVWRTVMRIPYILNNRPSGQKPGYIDLSGRLFPEQECIKTRFRISPPPKTYNLATMQNSPTMFTPPLYILNARTKRDGDVSSPGRNELYGVTDFHYPELEVKFGPTLQKLSLDFGKTGYENAPDPKSFATINTNVNGHDYSAEIFIRKEFSDENWQPILALYRKFKNENNEYIDPVRVGYVRRSLPEIDNAAIRRITPSIDPKKLVIYPDQANTYKSSKIVVRYLGSFGGNGVDNNCQSGSDDSCSAEIKLENIDQSTPTCNSETEIYKICAQRDICSKLNIECIQNEIDLHAAKIKNEPIDSFLSVRATCNNSWLVDCNRRKGLSTGSSSTITNPNPSGAPADPRAYGWFNEICISGGFDTKLKRVIAEKMSSGVMGKCLIDPNSPYIIDGDNSTNCNAGGKAPNCLCLVALDGVEIGDNQEKRRQTAHEAGLCVDMPLPKLCPAIDYNLSPNSDDTDLEYVAHSLNKTFYDSADAVHLSHQYRTEGKPAPDPITLKGHAEFSFGIFGMENIEGECKGFWRNKSSFSGISIPPKLSCLDENGNAVWGTTTYDECVRYDCQEVSTNGPDENGLYQGAYGATEDGEDKGKSHGFALWPKYTKTNDFLENVTATSCITGFKKTGATATTSQGTVSGLSLFNASIKSLITSYTGGTSPVRACNQLGQWQSPDQTKVCERISCPALVNNPAKGSIWSSDNSLPIPSDSGDSTNWALWENAGGAEFPSKNASRSLKNIRIHSESISTGTCKEFPLGFFKAPGGKSPTRKCDEFGNWGPVENPCVTTCNAIAGNDANSENNGFTYWNEVLNVPINGAVDGTITISSGNNGCIAGRYPYPYPPLKDKFGTSFEIKTTAPYRTDSGTNRDLRTIPYNLADDTRAATYPQRVCKSIISVGGASNVWTVPSSICVNFCPGSDLDTRIGAGRTQHTLRDGSTLTVDWPTTGFGQTVYKDFPALGQQSAFDYTLNRSNDYYSLARYCNSSTHKWDPVVPQCITNNTTIGTTNILYNSPTPRVAVESEASGGCLGGYYKGNFDTANTVKYKCAYQNSNNKIDEVYFAEVPNSGLPCQRYCSISGNQEFVNSINSSPISYCALNTNGTGQPCKSTTLDVNGWHFNCETRGWMGSYWCQEIGASPLTNQLVIPTTEIPLACKSGFGYPEDHISKDSADTNNSCSRSWTDRTNTRSSIRCQADGTWRLSGDCTTCRSCTLSSGVSNAWIDRSFHCTYSDNLYAIFNFNDGYNWAASCSSNTMSHGATKSCEWEKDIGECCDSWPDWYNAMVKVGINVTCTDGAASGIPFHMGYWKRD